MTRIYTQLALLAMTILALVNQIHGQGVGPALRSGIEAGVNGGDAGDVLRGAGEGATQLPWDTSVQTIAVTQQAQTYTIQSVPTQVSNPKTPSKDDGSETTTKDSGSPSSSSSSSLEDAKGSVKSKASETGGELSNKVEGEAKEEALGATLKSVPLWAMILASVTPLLIILVVIGVCCYRKNRVKRSATESLKEDGTRRRSCQGCCGRSNKSDEEEEAH